ncbi:MAG: cytochrome c oxidase assembly protein, partial [Opitutaceae bacterium]
CCSLLAFGAAFWWPIAAPQSRDRLNPLGGIVYLFTACLACTALGIIITLTPIEVCPIFRSPKDPLGILSLIRNGWGMSADRDRQLGGLLMWIPMCMVYMSAIFVELARWYGESGDEPSARSHIL